MQYYKNSMGSVIKSDSVFRTKGGAEIESFWSLKTDYRSSHIELDYKVPSCEHSYFIISLKDKYGIHFDESVPQIYFKGKVAYIFFHKNVMLLWAFYPYLLNFCSSFSLLI